MNLSDEEKLKRWNNEFNSVRELFKIGAIEAWLFRHRCRMIGLTGDEITAEITSIKQEQASQ